VGTTNLSLHASVLPLLIGGAGGVVIALLCIMWTLRVLARSSPRGLLTGSLEAAMQSESIRSGHRRFPASAHLFAIALAAAGLVLLIAAYLNRVGQTAAFFGVGTLLLAAALCYEYGWLTRKLKNAIKGNGWWPVSRLGFRNATFRPGRSILCVALIASAAFIIVAVDAFKRDVRNESADKKSG